MFYSLSGLHRTWPTVDTQRKGSVSKLLTIVTNIDNPRSTSANTDTYLRQGRDLKKFAQKWLPNRCVSSRHSDHSQVISNGIF